MIALTVRVAIMVGSLRWGGPELDLRPWVLVGRARVDAGADGMAGVEAASLLSLPDRGWRPEAS